MRVVCFGDSNTYGYDPRSCLGGRYDPEDRWVDILAAESGWEVENWGQNGREIPASAPRLPGDTAALIVMLGTNDLLGGRSAEAAAERLARFLTELPLARERILLIAPPPMMPGAWVAEERLVAESRAFAGACRQRAARLGVPFADGGDWGVELCYDGVHFTAGGHRAFARGLAERLRGLWPWRRDAQGGAAP